MKDTGQKVLIAYRTLPGESDSALVIRTDILMDNQHDSLMTLVESDAAQSSYEFAEVLARARFRDGSVMLSALHAGHKLSKVKTSEVVVIPNMQTSIGLDQLNQMIAEQRGISVNDLALGNSTSVQDIAKVDNAQDFIDVEKLSTAQEQEVMPTVTFDSPEAEAKHYRSQADKLAKQAAEFRRKAEELAPTKKVKTTE